MFIIHGAALAFSTESSPSHPHFQPRHSCSRPNHSLLSSKSHPNHHSLISTTINLSMRLSLPTLVAVLALSDQSTAFFFFPLFRPCKPWWTIPAPARAPAPASCSPALCPKQNCPTPSCIPAVNHHLVYNNIRSCVINTGSMANAVLSSDGTLLRC
ncbi:hypothetical protein G6O67_001144 [Ophiocordyceps sinensis]|uniref:Uncharacterized protein n=1 Tax=Ophiocordyceps sinensis TaxID=72228 RepID=A0A8H4PX99_9HYPO|nr:hypothetical protein G6O67_001144 [Ophiocordyceps sinensis]